MFVEQEKEIFLPVSQDLILLSYQDQDEIKRGFVLFYPSRDQTWVIEVDDTHEEHKE